jgi:hypothetical protein
MQHACIGQQRYFCLFRRLDDGAVLRQASAHFGRGDQQQLVGVGKSGRKRFGAGIVRLADHHAARRKILRFGGSANRSDDLVCRYGLEEKLDDKAAELAGSAGYSVHVGCPLEDEQNLRGERWPGVDL